MKLDTPLRILGVLRRQTWETQRDGPRERVVIVALSVSLPPAPVVEDVA